MAYPQAKRDSSMLAEAGTGGEKKTPAGGSVVEASATHAQKWEKYLAVKRRSNVDARARQKKWREENKDRVREFRRAWRDRAAPETLAGLLAAQGGRCKLCGDSLEKARHLDHIQPKSRGGASVIENYQYLCPPCNQSKGAFTNEEFLERIKLILLYNGKWWE
jgi:5-methylcytosine-specific restriction endonuclease McrA